MFLRTEVLEDTREIRDVGKRLLHVVVINDQTVRASLTRPTKQQIDKLEQLWEAETRPTKLTQREK